MKYNIEHIRDLIASINKYDEAYFTQNKSLITDEEYDKLWFELKAFFEDDEVKRTNLAKTEKLTMPLGVQSSNLAKVKHLVPVKSLDKIKIDSDRFDKDLDAFSKKYPSATGDWVVESKLDGLTIVIYVLKNGDIQFVTRGGGEKGENVTEQFKKIPSIYNAARALPKGMIVRGEALISKDNFEKINVSSNVSDSFSNARNLASASIRTLDSATAKKRHVEYIAYDILSKPRSNEERVEMSSLKVLSSYGFETVKTKHFDDYQSMKDFFHNQNSEVTPDSWRDDSYVEIDGLVIKPNTKIVHPSYNGHHELGLLAVKYAPEKKKTTLLNINWKGGKNGVMTPVAQFAPVAIGGTTISSASLGSYPILKKLDLRIGDTIEVERTNDVIPHVNKVLTSIDEHILLEPIELPEAYHLVGAKVIDESYQMPVEEVLTRFSNGVHIDAVKKAFFKRLVDAGKIASIEDLYTLSEDDTSLTEIKGIGKTTLERFFSEREASTHASFADILTGLDIEGLGKKAVSVLVTIWPDYTSLHNATDDEIEKFKDAKGTNIRGINAIKSIRDDKSNTEINELADAKIFDNLK